ncbi:MAG: Arm DNA-binding domain-containing protein [Desulfobulbaceae bacterium]|nr:Arm DNA-binding domain-containing protein [Desulfobulbaceae bacterium]
MPRRITPLTDTKVRTIKPAEKPQKLFDGGGLFLLVTPTGGKLWRLKYRFGVSRSCYPLAHTPKHLWPRPGRSVTRQAH